MNKKPYNSGWILCRSKSYPDKFYYFNVFNGEAAWCLNENKKKFFKKDSTMEKVKTNYPEPITSPHHRSSRASNNHSTITTCAPPFGQAIFPKYISNDKEIMLNIGTSSQMLQQVTNTKIMVNQHTQTEQDIINVNTHTFPLSNQFENEINDSLGSISYTATTNPKDWWKSINVSSNNGKHSDITDMQYQQKLATKPIIKESQLNKLQQTDITTIYNKHLKQESTQLHCNKVENPKIMLNDLRYVLTAKRRKAVAMQDHYNEVHKEDSTFNDTKKNTFNIRDNNIFNSEEKYIAGETAFTYNKNQQASEWYLVVDLDVLLEDYDFIKSYINKDANCHLYVPRVIQNELKIISKEEHGGRSSVIVARQLLRHLESVTPRLHLPDNKEDTKMLQIINCCLEIMKKKHDVVLVTKEIELIQTSKLYKIKAYHINDLKSNGLENNITHSYNKNNLFLQNTSDFNPFGLSSTIQATENNDRQNISGSNKSIFKYHLCVNLDISDIIISFSKLNIDDDNMSIIKKKVKNNLFENKIFRPYSNINCNIETFHNISNNKTVQSNSNTDIKNKIFNEKNNFKITFNTCQEKNKNGLENLEHSTNMNIIKPLNEVLEKSANNKFEDMLKKWNITDSVMENNLYFRFDEWVCSYEQIIEEFLFIILQKNLQDVNQPPPWCLHDGMNCLKKIYKENNYIINIIEKLLHYYDFSSENGSNIKPYNFMKLFGCGFYLVEALEETSPLLISDIKKKLTSLRNMIECPIEDLDVECPVFNKNTEEEYKCNSNFVKNPLDVMDYLKKNFSDWKNYYGICHDDTNKIEEKQGSKDNITVLRTFGKDLNKFTINKSKCLHFTKETDEQTHKYDLQCNNYPKIIRNITLLDTFEEKIKRNKSGLNYPEADKNISSISFDENKNKAIVNDRVVETNDFEILSVNNDSKNNDLKNNDSRNNDLNNNALKNKGSKNKDSKNKDSKNTDSKNKDSKNKDSKNKDSKNSDSKNKDSKNKDSKNKDSKNKDSKNDDSNNKDSNNDDSNNKDLNNDDSKNKDSKNTDSKKKDSKNKDSKNKDSNNHDSKNKDSNNDDSNNKDSNNDDSKNKDSNNGDSNNDDSKNKDSNNGDSNNDDSKNKDSNNDDLSINDINDPTKDSGFDSNSLFTYSSVRTFLSELCSSFKTVHTFIDETRKNYNEDIDEESKKTLYDKANKTHKYLLDIIDKLKIIIQRESKESSTLKCLLIKAGTGDKRTTRYRPVVMKCLEQAKILEKSLKLILSLTNDEELLSVDSSEENLDIINIFE